jgi:N utilization substance protein A
MYVEKVYDIIESIAHEKGLDIESVKEVVSFAIEKTAKSVYGQEYEYKAVIDEDTKKMKLHQVQKVVEDSEFEDDSENQSIISLSKAKEIDSDVEVGDELVYELSLEDLGRTAVATLQRELDYHIQRLIEKELFEKYKSKIGKIISGIVVRVDRDDNTFVEFEEVRAILTRKNRIKGESFKVGETIKSVIRKVYINRDGMQVELSRTTPKFLEELLRLEVPEIRDGLIEIYKSARIPGERAKVALISHSEKVDAVGATVGTKGVRINAVGKELNHENIDCIEYSPVSEIFIARSLSPAIISSVKIEGEKAIVRVMRDQKSKAIGKSGINIRLCSMLTGYTIELEEIEGVSQKDDAKTQESQISSDDSAMKALFGE